MHFFFASLGQFLLGNSKDLTSFFIAFPFIALGSALFSGTFDAMIFDSLKENDEEKNYLKIISKSSSFSTFAMLIASASGVLFSRENSYLTFIFAGLGNFVAFLFSFFLKEPSVDSEKFSFKNYFTQTKKGFSNLFSEKSKKVVLTMFGVSAIFIFLNESVGDLLNMKSGFTEQTNSIFITISYIVAMIFMQYIDKIFEKLKFSRSIKVSVIIISTTLFLNFFANNIFFAGSLALFRILTGKYLSNITSSEINKLTKSSERATTISTYNMLVHIPYAMLGYIVGVLMDLTSVKIIAVGLGFFLILLNLKNLFFEKS